LIPFMNRPSHRQASIAIDSAGPVSFILEHIMNK
jgi:hypothetical protein